MKFSVKVSDIAQITGGSFTGNGDLVINNFATSPETATESDLVFIYSPKFFKNISSQKAKAMILPLELKEKYQQEINIPVIWVERPRLVLKTLLNFIKKPKFTPKGIDKSASIHPSVIIPPNSSIGHGVFIGENSSIGENVTILPNTFIGSNVTIGTNTFIGPNCSVFDYSKIGCNVIIHAGVVIGSDGFSYVTEEESNLEKIRKGNSNLNFQRQIQHKIPSIGNVVIEDDVEIGANTTIDAGTIDSTKIGQGTKIDNLVMIAHNVKIGKDCLIVAQTAIAGSVVIGDRVVAGGQVGIADNISIGDDVVFVGGSAVHGNIESRSVYIGMPAVPYMDFIRNQKNQSRLPRKTEKLESVVKELEEKIKLLENKLNKELLEKSI